MRFLFLATCYPLNLTFFATRYPPKWNYLGRQKRSPALLLDVTLQKYGMLRTSSEILVLRVILLKILVLHRFPLSSCSPRARWFGINPYYPKVPPCSKSVQNEEGGTQARARAKTKPQIREKQGGT